MACDLAEEADGFNKEAGYTAMKKLMDLGAEMPRAVFVIAIIYSNYWL